MDLRLLFNSLFYFLILLFSMFFYSPSNFQSTYFFLGFFLCCLIAFYISSFSVLFYTSYYPFPFAVSFLKKTNSTHLSVKIMHWLTFPIPKGSVFCFLVSIFSPRSVILKFSVSHLQRIARTLIYSLPPHHSRSSVFRWRQSEISPPILRWWDCFLIVLLPQTSIYDLQLGILRTKLQVNLSG